MPLIEWSHHSKSNQHNKTLGVIGYAGRQMLRRYTVGIVSAAAVFVLALALVFVFRGMGANQAEPEVVISDPAQELGANKPHETPTPREPRIVATLTAEHDAMWDRRPGQDLYAGQRFNLTQGFAEITTKRGAIAILEAPSTVELIDDRNAIRLLSGKLLGICETESSKGFLVQTPHIEITDLGTRFGVAHSEAAGTRVHVFEGSVTTEPNISSGIPLPVRELVAGESQAVDRSGKEVDHRGTVAAAFTRLTQQSSGVARLSGQVQWANSATYLGTDPSTWPKDEQAAVMMEKRGYTLAKPLELSIASASPSNQDGVVDAGTMISTYILLYSPGGATPSLAEGLVVFDGEILGVVIDDQWDKSLRVLNDGDEANLLGHFDRLGFIEQYDADVIDLQPDGHTLAFKLKAGLAHDSVRVIVREPSRHTD